MITIYNHLRIISRIEVYGDHGDSMEILEILWRFYRPRYLEASVMYIATTDGSSIS